MNWTNNISMDINSTIADVNSSNKINFTISIMHSRDVKTATLFYENIKSYITARNVLEVATPIVFGILLFLGFLANIFVAYVTITTKRLSMHPLHSLLVLNLAAADVLYLFSSALYQAIAFSVPGWIYGSFSCPLLHFLHIQTMSVSIFTICFLAVMRFLALKIPFKMEKAFIATSEKHVGFFIIILVWLMGTGLSIPNAVFYRIVDHNKKNVNNTSVVGLECLWPDQSTQNAYRIALALVTFVLPLILVVSMYCFIGREILYFKKKNPHLDKEKRDYLNTTLVIFCLVLAFLICWFPYHLKEIVVDVSQAYKDFSSAKLRLDLRVVASCMSYAHACVNPIIYTFATSGFRQNLLLHCDQCISNQGPCLNRRSRRMHSSINSRNIENAKGAVEMSQGVSVSPVTAGVNLTHATQELRRMSSLSLKSYKSQKRDVIYEETDNLIQKPEGKNNR